MLDLDRPKTDLTCEEILYPWTLQVGSSVYPMIKGISSLEYSDKRFTAQNIIGEQELLNKNVYKPILC